MPSSKWRSERSGPNWLMDEQGRLIGYRDELGNEYKMPNEPAAGGISDNDEPSSSVSGAGIYAPPPGLIGKPRPTAYAHMGDSISTRTVFGSAPDLPLVADLYVERFIAAHPEFTVVTAGAVANSRLNGYGDLPAGRDSSHVGTILPFYNSMRQVGPAPQNLAEYRKSLEAKLLWNALPESAIVRIRNPDGSDNNVNRSQSGSWTNAGSGIAQGKFSAASGASQTFTVNGTSVAVFFMRGLSNAGASYTGKFSVTVDGVERVKGSTLAEFTPYLGDGEPTALVVSGLAAGDHTVVVTTLDTGTSWLTAAAGWTPGVVAGPHIICGNCLTMPAAGYALAAPNNFNDPGVTTDGPAWLKGDGGVRLINREVESAIRAVRSYGLSVDYVDIASVWRPQVHINGDLIHPTKGGHGVLFAAFEGAYRAHLAFRA